MLSKWLLAIFLQMQKFIVTLIEIQFLNEHQVFSAASRCTHGLRWTRVFVRLTADSCSAMSGSKIQIPALERHPEHLITTPLNRGEPILTEQMGHAVELHTGRASPSPPPSVPLIQTQTDTS